MKSVYCDYEDTNRVEKAKVLSRIRRIFLEDLYVICTIGLQQRYQV